MDEKIIIAIDGYSSCGKSTLAQDLSNSLGYKYIDSGAMYRCVTLYFTRNQIDYMNSQAVVDALSQISIRFEKTEDGNSVFLNEENVSKDIRGMEISNQVSQVSTVKEIRGFLVEKQRSYGMDKGLVMDGRDIGTVVYPNAELKIFMTADAEVRAERRYQELKGRGLDLDYSAVMENLRNRDRIDESREISPLKKAEDAIVLNNSFLDRKQQLTWAKNLILLMIKR